MSCINHDCVRTGIHQCLHTLQCIGSNTYTGSYTQTTFGIFTSHRFIFCFCNIFISDKTDQLSIHSDNRKFLNLMFLKNLCSRFQVSRLVSSHQSFFRSHDKINVFCHVSFETQISVGNNTHQITFIIYHRDTTDFIFRHDVQCILNSRTSFNRYRVINHTIFGTLYDSNLSCLFFDRHIFVNHTDTTFTSNGNRHFRFGNCIHGSRHKRYF